MNNRPWLVPVLVFSLVLFLCCLCVFLVGAGAALIGAFSTVSEIDQMLPPSSREQPTPEVIRPSGPAAFEPVPTDTLEALANTIVPVNDPRELARRLEGKGPIPETVAEVAAPLELGAREQFWVSDVDTDENFQIEATLEYITDHLYFWVQDGIRFDQDELASLAETFETRIYPTNRAFFGSEWTPGVDGDPHLYIIYAEGLGRSLAGYFSSVDSLHPLAHEYSNAHEMFVLNADNVDLDEQFTYGVLAHEFQHMIHWNQDRNEQSWVNEGFSELAAFINGYGTGGADFVYANNPDLQLNDWPNDPSRTTPHYGAAFLFLTYFLDRFGESATQALVSHPENGLESVDVLLGELAAVDPLTGTTIGTDDLFMDWALANYLQDASIGDGRYAYQNYPGAPQAVTTETIRVCPTPAEARDVRQYGTDYIRISCSGDYVIEFEGSVQVGVLPADPFSGEYTFWSSKSDESDMTLTRSFDFRAYRGPLTLSYWTWYDIEENWDYVYVEASTDGEDWEILVTPSGTDQDPTGNSYGWGYTGLSGGGPRWIQEQLDLSRYAGQEVQLRFEYITDAAVNGEGLLLDDVGIPEIGYFSDFEAGDGGWEAAGFVRIRNVLPQTFRLALVQRGQLTLVEQIELAPDNTAVIPVSIGEEVNEVVLVVSGTTRFTRQPAAYRLAIQPVTER